ncbi:MAG: TorF family putative porin [Halioglobus sp.]|nr:TorF family putative porin [Halioglobus sp.]
MLNKKLLSASVAAALVAGMGAAQVQAADDFEVSGNIALTTDYRFRGISQSDEDVAVQGGFDAAFAPGFYVGVWGSSVDFGGGVYGSIEMDYYAGWAGNIGDTDFGIDVGYVYYDYPGDKGCCEGDYQEFYVGTSWRDLTLQLNYSDDYYAETEEFWYLSADYSFALPTLEALTVGLHAGYNILDEDDGFLAPGEDEYLDYSVSVSYSVFGVDLSLAWVGTDLDEDDVGSATEELADDTAVFTISKSL